MILDHELTTPDGAAFESNLQGDAITITIDLLNPGETFTVGLTVADSPATHGIKAVARAEFLELWEIGDSANTSELLEAILPHVFYGRLVLDLYKISSRRQR